MSGGQPATGQLILVVDDDEAVRSLLVRFLTLDGYEVDQAADASTAVDAITRRRPDLVLLDVVLPGQDGLDLLSELRRHSEIPVILLTGRGDEADRVVGLKLGADDYIVKPFSPAELGARITSVLRRSGATRRPERLQFGDLCLDLGTRELTVRGRVVPATVKEFDLLAFLAASPRQVFSREQLLERVWGSSSEWQNPATVTEHVRRIRRHIESDPHRPRWICTVRGVGYRFEP